MEKVNCARSSCKDVFNAFMVSDADYSGKYEFPVLFPTYQVPNRLIVFSKALKTQDYNQWIHFYEDDVSFERIWRNPQRYLPLLKKFNGVILPDFSIYRDMPLAMQIWNKSSFAEVGRNEVLRLDGWYNTNDLNRIKLMSQAG